jgi:hypothetical protein
MHFGLALSLSIAAALAAAQNPAASMPRSMSQSAAPPAQSPATTPGAPALAAGGLIPAELSKSLDARKAKVGDRVEAKTTVDLLGHGQILLPRNTKIVGHVTEAKARSKESPDSLVAISFDQVLLKDGRKLPAQVVVQAIGRPLPSSLPNSDPLADSVGSISPAGTASAGGSMGGSGVGGPTMGNPSSSTAQNPYPGGMPPGAGDIGARSQAGGTTVAALGPTSQGAIGMKGISLLASGQATVISSSTQNVHLDSGTQLILRTQ